MRLLLIVSLLFSSTFLQSQNLRVQELSCEHMINPVGIDVTSPRLSWIMMADGRNNLQAAYSIRVATDPSFRSKSLVWNTGRVASDASVLLPYAGKELRSSTRYYWQVKIWDNKGNESAWSPAAYWETGLLQKSDWKAKWIEPRQDTVHVVPGLQVRREFELHKKPVWARVYVSAHGFYQLYLNGQRVGDQELTPGWTEYKKELQYQVYDVTDQLKKGSNAVGAMLGNGWYRGTLAWGDRYGLWGKKMGLICQLVVKYSDGSSAVINSDDSWKGTNEGPVGLNGIYEGEDYDARHEQKGWASAGFNDAGWQAVQVADYSLDNLTGTQSVPVRKIQELKPIRIFHTPSGTLVADMGQNMVGWVRLKVKGPAGTRVTIRHAEVLDKYGEFYTANLRAARVTVNYTLKGEGEEVYEPHFTFMGFRYVAISGYPGELKPDDITGVVLHSDMQPTGSFECSNSLVNQLQHNIQWGQKGNFVDVPTDCPQRDERLGWTGDAQAFCRTAAFNLNVSSFFSKWLRDLSADQEPGGQVPYVIPDVLRNKGATSAGWGDVATIAPWTMYTVYGDKGLLERQYPSMKAYVEYIRQKAGSSYIWKNGSVFGDWLFYKSMQQGENDGYTSPDMIATMFFAYSTSLLSKAAEALGKTDDKREYEDLFGHIREAFMHNYVTPTGRIASESQTSYVLALMFDLLPPELRPAACQYMVDDIRSRGNHLSTGFLGTPYLCHVLSSQGRSDVAYDLLLQKTYPSWLYPVTMGATTIWERWDGQKTDSTFQDKGMNSFNHYAYGAIGDWMYRVSAGIEAGSPGYKHIIIQPHPTDKLEFARASYQSVYGLIKSGWERKDGHTIVKLSIPANTRATILLPVADVAQIMEGGKPLSENFTQVTTKDGLVSIEAGSGDYSFQF